MPRRPLPRGAAALAVVVLALVWPGCGDDDEPDSAGGAATTPRESDRGRTQTATGETAPDRVAPGAVDTARTTPSREDDVEGGPGDEEPIRSQAVFTGRGGTIAPELVRVPPFVAVELVLRSGDGGRYGLRVEGRTLSAGPGRPRDAVLLEGLPPGGRYSARPAGSGGRLTVEASAEPGP